MSIEQGRAYLVQRGYGDRILEFAASSATVELAAQAVQAGWHMLQSQLWGHTDR